MADISSEEYEEALEQLTAIVFEREEIGEVIASVLSEMQQAAEAGELAEGWTGTDERHKGEEVYFRFFAEVDSVEGSTAELNVRYEVEAITNLISFAASATVSIDGEMKPTNPGQGFLLSPAPPAEELIASIICKGADDDDIVEKISYIDNINTLLEFLV